MRWTLCKSSGICRDADSSILSLKQALRGMWACAGVGEGLFLPPSFPVPLPYVQKPICSGSLFSQTVRYGETVCFLLLLFAFWMLIFYPLFLAVKDLIFLPIYFPYSVSAEVWHSEGFKRKTNKQNNKRAGSICLNLVYRLCGIWWELGAVLSFANLNFVLDHPNPAEVKGNGRRGEVSRELCDWIRVPGGCHLSWREKLQNGMIKQRCSVG